MRNWADLPDDLLDLILSKLLAKERYCFSLICRSWNKVASISPYRHSPCLMYYSMKKQLWEFYQYNNFFHMSFPELKTADIRCSKYGWLLMTRPDDSIFFFDPFNNRKVDLPCKLRFQYSNISFFNPPTSPDCIVVGIATLALLDYVNVGVLKRGEFQWDNKKYPLKNIPFLASHAPPIWHRRRLYLLGLNGNIATLNIKNRDAKSGWFVHSNCLKQRRFHKQIKERFLFKVKGEEALFAVFVHNDQSNVNVFRLSERKMKWKLVKDIGDKVLYLSQASSLGETAHLKSMANRIYFPKLHGDSYVYYSLCTGKYHSLDGYCSDNSYGLESFDFAARIIPAPTPELMPELTW